MIDADQYCKEKIAHSGSSFYYSFMFLPKQKRQAILALYTFCREIDDIADSCPDKEIAAKKLIWWVEEVERIYKGTPEHPVGYSLEGYSKDFNLPKDLLLKIIDGMNMDLNYQGFEKFSDLKLYCHCVAGVVGQLSARIFGFTDPKTLDYAYNLGIAFQLVNIIRDVGEDARMGRIYLPEEDLKQFNISPEEILSLNILNKDNFKKLLKFQAERARSYYEKALNLLPDCDRFSQKSGLIMAKIYFTILEEIGKNNFEVLNQRISLTPFRKFWIAWKENKKENSLNKKYNLAHAV